MCAIEYYGLNIKNGIVISEKFYYNIADKDSRPFMPAGIAQYLLAFDTCKRSNNKYSVSYFLKSREPGFYIQLISYLNDSYGLNIDTSEFITSFSKVSHFEDGSHYDPVFSVQVEGNRIIKASFYVNTVIDKSLCPLFFRESIESIGHVNASCMECMEGLMRNGTSLMYLSSWEYEFNGRQSNKIYLKVKNPNEFSKRIESYYPWAKSFLSKDQYKLSCFAFSLVGTICDHINIYFKPL